MNLTRGRPPAGGIQSKTIPQNLLSKQTQTQRLHNQAYGDQRGRRAGRAGHGGGNGRLGTAPWESSQGAVLLSSTGTSAQDSAGPRRGQNLKKNTPHTPETNTTL